MCWSLWSWKTSDTTEWLNWTELSYLAASLGFSTYSIILYTNNDSFTPLPPICVPFISFLFSLISKSKTSKPMLNKSARVEILVLLPILEKMLSVFHHYDVSCRLVIYGLYYVEVCSFCARFLESYCHNWVLNFVKAFYVSIEMIVWLIFSNLLMWCITHWFVDIEKSLHPWNKYHMIMVYDDLMELASILYTIVFIYFHQWYWPVIFFFLKYLCMVLVSG